MRHYYLLRRDRLHGTNGGVMLSSVDINIGMRQCLSCPMVLRRALSMQPPGCTLVPSPRCTWNLRRYARARAGQRPCETCTDILHYSFQPGIVSGCHSYNGR